MALINASSWPITKTISMQSKTEITQCLLLDELINKRDNNTRSFRKGLKVLGFFDICMNQLEVVEPLFVHNDQELTVNVFLRL